MVPFVCLVIVVVVICVIVSTNHEKESKQNDFNHTEIDNPKPKNTYNEPTQYFNELFAKLSHFKQYGTRRYIDITIFAIYLLRSLAKSYVSQLESDEEKQGNIMLTYDFIQFSSFITWMDKHAPECPIEIIDERIELYDYVFYTADMPNSNIRFSVLTIAFYRMLDNGWEIESDKQTMRPNSIFDISELTDAVYLQKKYQPLMDELDMIVTSFFGRECKNYFSYLKSEVDQF